MASEDGKLSNFDGEDCLNDYIYNFASIAMLNKNIETLRQLKIANEQKSEKFKQILKSLEENPQVLLGIDTITEYFLKPRKYRLEKRFIRTDVQRSTLNQIDSKLRELSEVRNQIDLIRAVYGVYDEVISNLERQISQCKTQRKQLIQKNEDLESKIISMRDEAPSNMDIQTIISKMMKIRNEFLNSNKMSDYKTGSEGVDAKQNDMTGREKENMQDDFVHLAGDLLTRALELSRKI